MSGPLTFNRKQIGSSKKTDTFKCLIVILGSGGDSVGVLTPDSPHLLAVWGPSLHGPPPLLLPCCYTWPVIHSISSADSG